MKEKLDGSSLISCTWGELDCLFKWDSDWHLGASFLHQSTQNSYQNIRICTESVVEQFNQYLNSNYGVLQNAK
jgi:hypothetical protein